MKINDLRPRIFYDGEMWQVENINYEHYIMKLKNKSGGLIILKSNKMFDEEKIKIDRPVGMIKDYNRKGVILYENDIIEVENEENPGEKSRHVVEWGGNWNPLRSFKRLTFALVPQFYDEKELSIDLSMVLFSGIMKIEIIGNVHENPGLAKEVWPEGWERYKNANSQ